MSRTRQLIARLRDDIGAASPMPKAPPHPRVPAPPARVFPREQPVSRYARECAGHTTALLGIGHVGTRYATDVVLQFQAELAVAHGAVAAQLPEGWARENGWIGLKSRVRDHREFLLRPGLVRCAGPGGRRALRRAVRRLPVGTGTRLAGRGASHGLGRLLHPFGEALVLDVPRRVLGGLLQILWR